jgi:low affinity Fe/Cu permease
MLERPTIIGHGRARFDRFAEMSAAFVGRAAFFATAVSAAHIPDGTVSGRPST